MTAGLPGLREAFHEFATRALTWFAARDGVPTLYRTVALPTRWQRSGNSDSFRLAEEVRWSARTPMAAVPGYEDLRAAMLADAVAAPQIDALIGGPFGGSLWQFEMLVYDFLRDVVARTSSYVLDPDAIDAAYDAVEAELLRETVDVVVVSVVAGIELFEEQLDLEPGVVARRLSDDELAALLVAGAVPRDDRGAFDAPMMPVRLRAESGVVHRQTFPKRVGASDPSSVPLLPNVARAADRFVDAVRLARGDAVRGPVVQFETVRNSGFSTEVRTAAFPVRARGTFQIFDGSARVVAANFRGLSSPSVVGSKVLDVCLRRVAGLPVRESDEDSMLDLMIAAEALFLSENSGDPQRGDLKYRLALRAAMFTPMDHIAPLEVQKFMGKAYDVRSKIVHGAAPKEKDLVDLRGARTTLGGMIADLESVLLAALHKAIALTAAGEPVFDWDAQIWARWGSERPVTVDMPS